MPAEWMTLASQFGFPSLCVVALGAWAVRQDALARVERAESRAERALFVSAFDRLRDVIAEHTAVLRGAK